MSSDNSNIAASNSLISSDLQFGSILFDEKYGKNMEKFTSAGLSSNILFRWVNCHKKEEEKKKRKYIYIGAMQVDVDDWYAANVISILAEVFYYFIVHTDLMQIEAPRRQDAHHGNLTWLSP